MLDMYLIPRCLVGRLLASFWLVCCLAVLVFGFVQRDIHDMVEAFVWFMIFLSAPLGLLVIPFLGSWGLAESLGYPYEPFFDLLPLWCGASVVGYMQWFIVAPWLARKIFRRA